MTIGRLRYDARTNPTHVWSPDLSDHQMVHTSVFEFEPFVGPLDSFPTLRVALSFGRRVREDYSGPLIRVRKGGTTQERDFYSVESGVLNTSELMGFVGASDGLIVKAYDQTGAGRDFFQTVESRQPKIVTAGVLETLNGKPVVNFTRSSSHGLIYLGTDLFGGVSSYTVNIVHRSTSVNFQNSFLISSGLLDGSQLAVVLQNNPFTSVVSTFRVNNVAKNDGATQDAWLSNTFNASTMKANGTTTKIYRNSTELTLVDSSAPTVNSADFVGLNGRSDGSFATDTKIAEFLLWHSHLDDTESGDLIAEQISYFGLT